MQTTLELTRLGAGELARSIAAGDVSAREVVDAHLARLEALEPDLNALAVPRGDVARAEADAADAARRRGEPLGPLHGVPVTVKDQFDVAGLPTSFGVARLAERPVAHDGPMVAALRQAGAIVLGKTNVPQTLAAIETDSGLFGRTCNPWDLTRTPGGSSGGDAALVAAGCSPLSLAADFGGSLRIPAAWCGIATLRPTAGRLPQDLPPIRTASSSEGVIAQPGPLARSTDDVELALKVMVDAIAARPTERNAPVPWRPPPQGGVQGRRIAVLREIDGFAPSPAIRRAIDEAAAALRAAGAEVETWDGAPDPAQGVALGWRIFTADGGSWFTQLLAGDRPDPLIKPDLQVMSLPNPARRALAVGLQASGQHRAARLLRQIGTGSAGDLLDLLGDRRDYTARFLAAMDAEGYDLLLTPATPLPAAPHGLTAKLPDLAAPSALTVVLGMPSGVVPVTRVRPGEESDRPASRDAALRAAAAVEEGSAGLPVGVQVVARHWREDLVLAAMRAIESQVRPGTDVADLPASLRQH